MLSVARSGVASVKNSVRSVSALATRDVLAKGPHAEVSELKNGLRVSTENNGRPTTTVGVWIETGSRYENESNNGVSRLLEHMIHKGTGKRSEVQLESELSSIGAKLVSETSRDHTAIFVQSASQDVEKVVDVLADVLRNSKLDSSAIEGEKKHLLSALEEAEEDHMGVVMDNLHAAAFQGTSLARSPLGNTNAIKAMDGSTLKQWQADHYRPVRMVLSAVGGVEHAKLTQLTEKYFGDLSNSYPGQVPHSDGVRFTGSEFRFRNDNVPHMYGAIAVEGVGYGHHDALALRVASQFVGQWDVTHGSSYNAPSKLVQQVSHGFNLHAFHNFSLNYKDTGLFGVQFICKGDSLDDATSIARWLQHEWKHLSSAVDEDEVNRSKNALRTHLYQALETNTQKAAFNAKEILHTGGVRSLADIEDSLEKLDKTAVREAVSRHVYDRDIAASGVGRTEAWPNYAQLRYGMSWWKL